MISALLTIEVRPIAAAPASINLGVLFLLSNHSRNFHAFSCFLLSAGTPMFQPVNSVMLVTPLGITAAAILSVYFELSGFMITGAYPE